jgi:hypothetical protein
MLPLVIPPGTTIESLVTEVIPAAHARLVGESAPKEVLLVALRIDGCGSWTVRIQGRTMLVDVGEEPRPTLWMYTTKDIADRFLQDALGPKRLVAQVPPNAVHTGGGVLTMSDPRVIRRVAMASGRIELVVVDEDGARLAVVFGFGDATRRPIDPEDPDTVAEAPVATLQGVLRGERGPDEALASGDVRVRGSRMLALQLALAVAPFYPTTK